MVEPVSGAAGATKATAEHRRLADANRGVRKWRRWGPYLSERQWGTVREDYSPHGNAWGYFPHDHARSRAYRWGEDGLAGFSDIHQRLCVALALWNGQDPIVKERLFGLTGPQGNHGEDVKEYYYYQDATPTHSYLKYLYKYPQAVFPYSWLVEENARRGKNDAEFELVDTGVFDEDRYFDVVVEYAKAGTDDFLMQITVHNRGPEAAPLHVLGQLWFRNTWRWASGRPVPEIRATKVDKALRTQHEKLGTFRMVFDAPTDLLVCANETNAARLFGSANTTAAVKDGINGFRRPWP